MSPQIREVDPGDLRFPPSRASGVDPWKLHQQIRQFGARSDDLPPILGHEDPDGVLEITDGVTRGHESCETDAGRARTGRRDRPLPPQPGEFAACEGPEMSADAMPGDVFNAIRSLAEAVPEMRAGQLVAALGELCSDLHGRGLWDASDDELLEAAWQFRRGLKAATISPGGHDA